MRHMTQRSIQMEDEPRPLAWPSSSPPEFTIPSETRSSVGYIVSTWPSLSQTFVLNEVLALERRGVQLRIFSTKDPKNEPVHADAGSQSCRATSGRCGASLRLTRALCFWVCFGRDGALSAPFCKVVI